MELLLTLGHNSSAVLVKDGKILVGYEEERLSKVKSDSSFPKLSIDKIISYFPECTLCVDKIYVGHWFNKFGADFNNKYFDKNYLKVRFKNAEVIGPSKDMTHHDLHANSMWNLVGKSGTTIVSDGFGNMEEVLSVYSSGKLVHRCYDLLSSFGLMYQYATSYVGGIENKDEYKFISYETRVDPKLLCSLDKIVEMKSNEMLNNILSNCIPIDVKYSNSMVVDVKKLGLVKESWHSFYDSVIGEYGIDQYSPMGKSVVGYVVQKILETTMMRVIDEFNPSKEGVKLVGGVFNNAKLNNKIARNVSKIDVHPVSGDQGTGLGFTKLTFSNLNWGIREFKVETNNGKFIEVIRDNIEFGSRSLLNTSVVSHDCTEESASHINSYYNRDNSMPMAFACTSKKFNELFEHSDKVGITRQYMTLSLDLRDSIPSEEIEKIKGVLLFDPFRNKWTGRCQVIDSDEYVNKYGIVINTSLNAHGQPLLYDENDYNEMLRLIGK